MKKFYDTTWKKIVIALLVLAILGTVFGGTAEESQPETKAAPVVEKEEPKRSEECIKVKPAIQKTVVQDNAPVGEAWAVKSNDYSEVWMVATQFKIGDDTETMVLGINDLRPGHHLTVAVDGMADEFTTWPHEAYGEEFSIADHGAQEAVDCIDD